MRRDSTWAILPKLAQGLSTALFVPLYEAVCGIQSHPLHNSLAAFCAIQVLIICAARRERVPPGAGTGYQDCV